MHARSPRLLSIKPLTLLSSSAIFLLSAYGVLNPSSLGLDLRGLPSSAGDGIETQPRQRNDCFPSPRYRSQSPCDGEPGENQTGVGSGSSRHCHRAASRQSKSRGDRSSQCLAQQPAQTKASNGTIPSPFIVTQLPPHAVAVSLPTTSFRTYKHFSLSHPHRLVIDVTPPIDAKSFFHT